MKTQQNPIHDTTTFDSAISLFMDFEPVKIRKDLADNFRCELFKKWISIDDEFLKYRVIPQKKAYKFERIK